MKKIGYTLIALIFLGVVGVGIYFSVKNMKPNKENEKPAEETVNYKVKFNSNGGTEVQELNIKKGEKLTRPVAPTKEGYVFDNWYVGESLYNFDTPITEDITLEAKWISEAKKTFKVTFKYNNGSRDSVVTVEQYTRVSKPATVYRKGYTFKGWYLNGYVYNFNNSVKKDLVIEAKWDKEETPVEPSTTVINPTEIKLDKSTITVNKGTSSLLKATVYPSNATNPGVTWSTSNSSVATVSGGKVTALKVGEAIITAKTANGKTATCKVIVDNPLTGLSIKKISGADALYFGGPSITLEATKIPGDTTTSGIVEWFSYDAMGQNGSITFTTSGNRVVITPRTGGASSSATMTAKLSGIQKTYSIPIENKLSFYGVEGDANYNAQENSVKTTKYPAIIKFKFNVVISNVTNLSNATIISGLNTSTVTLEVRAGGVSTPGAATFVTKGGQTKAFHIQRGY